MVLSYRFSLKVMLQKHPFYVLLIHCSTYTHGACEQLCKHEPIKPPCKAEITEFIMFIDKN